MIEQLDYALTAKDIKKLREADKVSFRRCPKSSHISASNEKYTPNGAQMLWEHEVQVASTIKAAKWGGDEELAKVAYCHLLLWHANNIHEPWHTIAGLLRVGDCLELEWRQDSITNGYLEKANLHGDRVKLIVHRGAKKLVFTLGVSVCEDNTARLIRRGAYNNE